MKNVDRVMMLDTLISENSGNKKVVRQAMLLQVALLTATIGDIRNIMGRNPRPKLQDGLTLEEEAEAARNGGKIRAVKLVRERWIAEGKGSTSPYGLLEAKNLVEAWMQKNLGFTHWPAGNSYRDPYYDNNNRS